HKCFGGAPRLESALWRRRTLFQRDRFLASCACDVSARFSHPSEFSTDLLDAGNRCAALTTRFRSAFLQDLNTTVRGTIAGHHPNLQGIHYRSCPPAWVG